MAAVSSGAAKDTVTVKAPTAPATSKTTSETTARVTAPATSPASASER